MGQGSTDEHNKGSTSKAKKLSGMEFYTKILKSPKLIVAPMVDQSELAWRLLSRRHGAQLCYSPMYHSNIFVQDSKYREQALQSCPEDRPLIIQFCGNDTEILLQAALLAQDHCDAIDLNLGCPQAIAKRGHYGSFLQDEWELLEEIVSALHDHVNVPITCKIRRFDDVEKTIQYAQMLTKAGAQMLTVHGRTREQKGPNTGVADWKYIKAVRESVDVPVFANGNIMSIEDIERCLEETGVNGVMTAEGNLHNPAIFERCLAVSWAIAIEYLDLVEQYPCPQSYIRGHMFKIFHHLLNLKSNSQLREDMATSHKVQEFRNVVNALKEKYEPYHEGAMPYIEEDERKDCNLSLPPWICQPYIRLPPDQHDKVIAEKLRQAADPNTAKREYFDDEGQPISRKKMKKLRRVSRRPKSSNSLAKADRYRDLCANRSECLNPMGQRCSHKLCRNCCKNKCFTDRIACDSHGFLLEKVNRPKRKKAVAEN